MIAIKVYGIVGLVVSVIIGFFVWLYFQNDIYHDFSLNMIVEMLGLVITIFIVDVIFKLYYKQRATEIENEEKYLKWAREFYRERSALARYIYEIFKMLELMIESWDKNTKPDPSGLRIKLVNPPILFSLQKNKSRLENKDIEVLGTNTTLLQDLEVNLRNDSYEARTLHIYKSDLFKSMLNILKISPIDYKEWQSLSEQ